MISICRALNIPARLSTGIDYGADPVPWVPPTSTATWKAFLGDRGNLFDPSGISPRMASSASAPGATRAMSAFDDPSSARSVDHAEDLDPRGPPTRSNGIVKPFRHDYAVSTDSAGAEPDEAVAQLQGPAGQGTDGGLHRTAGDRYLTGRARYWRVGSSKPWRCSSRMPYSRSRL
jgi:hypothetical protein